MPLWVGTNTNLKNLLCGTWSGSDAPYNGYIDYWLDTANDGQWMYFLCGSEAKFYGVNSSGIITTNGFYNNADVRPILEVLKDS